MYEENDNFEFKEEIEIEYICFAGCNEVFSSERELRAHLKIHKKSSASADNDPVIQSSEITNNNHPDEEIRVLKAETRDKEFVDFVQVEESQSETPSPLQTEESAAGQPTGNLESKNEAKLEFHCPKCRNFYTYEENFWKRQDGLNISLSNIIEVQDHIMGMTTNVKEQALDVATQTREDNPLNDFLEFEDPQNGNSHSDRSSYSRNSQNPQQSENEEEIQREMGNSEEFEIEDEIQFEFKCFSCCVTVTTQKDLWNHLNFHKKTLSKSKNLTQQNQMDNKQSEHLKNKKSQEKLNSSKNGKHRKALKRKCDFALVSNSMEWKVENVTKNKKFKQPKKTIQGQETAEVASTYSHKQSEKMIVSSNLLKKKKNRNLKTLKPKIQNQKALKKKIVPDTQLPENSTVKDSESSNRKEQTTESYISDTETSTPTDLNTQEDNSYDQNFQETFEEIQISIPSQVSKDEIEGQIVENRNQAQEDNSMFNCQVRVRFTSVFLCEVCKEYFLTEQELTEHVKSYSNEIDRKTTTTESDKSKERDGNDRKSRKIKFECDLCGRQLRWKSELKKHILSVHCDVRPYKCGSCEKTFKYKHHLKAHQMSMHSELRLFPCKKCEKSFKTKLHLSQHQRVHSDEKPYKCGCSGCDKAFKSKDELTKHRIAHSDEKPYKCLTCEKTFKDKSNFKTHLVKHSELRPYSCKKCEKSFKTNRNLLQHQQVHTEIKLHECQQCFKKFKSKHHLRIHQKAHSDEKPYKCLTCEKTFKDKSNFKTHLVKHSELRPYSCKKCEKAFKTNRNLLQHQQVHTEIKLHECQQCFKKFKSKHHLRKHRIAHSDEKPYKCLTCEKTFKIKSNLKVHQMRIHSEITQMPTL